MTITEAIHIFEHSKLVSDNFTIEGLTAAYVHILAALHAQQERENPEPLTLDELLEMAADETSYIYVSRPNHDVVSGILDFDNIGKWGKPGDVVAVVGAFEAPLLEADYGSTWVAYRHLPEEK